VELAGGGYSAEGWGEDVRTMWTEMLGGEYTIRARKLLIGFGKCRGKVGVFLA